MHTGASSPLHVWLNLLIAFAYFSIPVTVAIFIRRAHTLLRIEAPLVASGFFVLSCGTGHALDAFGAPLSARLWVHGVTALTSLMVAVSLPFYVPRVVRMLQDMHEGKRARHRNEHQLLRRYEGLISATASVVWVKDAAGVMTDTRHWCAFTGQTPEEATADAGWGWLQAVHPEDRARVQSEWAAAFLRRLPCDSEYRIRNHKGVYLWYSTRAAPIYAASGELREWIGACFNVQDRKETEQAIERANQSKTDFLAVMSHELRTPLTAVMGYTELLHDGVLGPVQDEQKHTLDRITASARHLTSLIEQILDFTRVEAGRVGVDPRAVTLGEFVESTVTLVAPLMPPTVELRVEQQAAATDTFTTDPVLLRQVLLNVLTNAAKFTEAGSVLLTVRLTEVDVTFGVIDTGCGMTAEELTHVFEPFWQSDQGLTRRRSQGGTGLGLSVVQRILPLLRGTIGLQSTAGFGTRVDVCIPRHLTVPATQRMLRPSDALVLEVQDALSHTARSSIG